MEKATGSRSCAAEWFFKPDGRCVLMRRYNGPEWDNYPELTRAPTLADAGVEYRLWHDTVLWEPRVRRSARETGSAPRSA